MKITNRGTLEHYDIEEDLGIVTAFAAPTRFILRDIIASIRNMLGQEMKEYVQMMEKARIDVVKRLVKNAEALGADAIINVRFASVATQGASAELLVYGTAVKLKCP